MFICVCSLILRAMFPHRHHQFRNVRRPKPPDIRAEHRKYMKTIANCAIILLFLRKIFRRPPTARTAAPEFVSKLLEPEPTGSIDTCVLLGAKPAECTQRQLRASAWRRLRPARPKGRTWTQNRATALRPLRVISGRGARHARGGDGVRAPRNPRAWAAGPCARA